MLRLRKYDFNVPGGYRYVQPETGMKFDGNTLFKPQVKAILTHRKANNLTRTTWDEVADDLEAYTCARMPGVCYGTTDNTRQSSPARVAATRKCGGCGGRRVKPA